jgi:glucose/arabinose dehydrogenase
LRDTISGGTVSLQLPKARPRIRRGAIAGWLTAFFLPLFYLACGGGAGGDGLAQADAPFSSMVSQPLEVPEALAGEAPAGKTLTVPAGFGIRVWARLDGARFMALAPNGDVLVSVPGAGKIVLLRQRNNDVPQAFDFATGLRKPHDMVFRTIGGVTWLYVAESHRVSRTVYQSGQATIGQLDLVVGNLPDSSTPGLGGAYGHELKNIAIGPDNTLYVSIASSCNACVEDAVADPVRGAIYRYDAGGGNGRLFARGLRNAEGLDIMPGTSTLWAAVNNRDEIRVPVDQDVDGDGQGDLGSVVQSYVDLSPPEPFTAVQDGAHYGWPFCNGIPNADMRNISLLPDFELNRGGQVFDCGIARRASLGLPAHSAPLGLSFLQDSALPASLRAGAAIALHGCWNCSRLQAGYKVVFVPFDAAGNALPERDLVTGFVANRDTREVWGRPVDVLADAQGNLLISDDFAGLVYQLYPKQDRASAS